MVSVIIPVYNEELTLQKNLPSLLDNSDIEIIVVDGGSGDGTLESARRFPVKVEQCSKNRAIQMNKGAEVSSGDMLLFLHADCLFDKDGLELVKSLAKSKYVGGCFSQRIDSSKIIYRVIEASGNLRAKISKIFYGDQAVFIRRDVFFELGGFDGVSMFEDVLFSKKMMRAGISKVLNARVYTSPRRWEKNGILKTTLINWILTMGFLLNIPLNKLKKFYSDIR